MSEARSVITCDLEGRVQTFNTGAEHLFGYAPEEVIGRKRVSAFSPGLIVLGHVGAWLKSAREQGAHECDTVFLHRDGTLFSARIRITPTFKRGRQIGYCGVTTALPDVAPESVMPRIHPLTRLFAWLVVTRAPFLTATLVPLAIAAAWVWSQGTTIAWGAFALASAAVALLHVAANTFNDYFDWTSGTDPANNEYFMPFSGGSRSIELGLVTERGLLRVAISSLLAATVLGAALLWIRGPGLLLFGLAGAFSAFFYTAPPLRLAARKGLGELFVGLNFGPLIVGGMGCVLRGELNALDFAVGLPAGLLTAAILWVNEFPDSASDALTGKTHLVVVLGKQRARWGYLALVLVPFLLVAAGALAGILPVHALLMLAALPLAVHASRIVLHHYDDRELVRASAATIRLHLLAGLLLAVGLVLARLLGG